MHLEHENMTCGQFLGFDRDLDNYCHPMPLHGVESCSLLGCLQAEPLSSRPIAIGRFSSACGHMGRSVIGQIFGLSLNYSHVIWAYPRSICQTGWAVMCSNILGLFRVWNCQMGCAMICSQIRCGAILRAYSLLV